jgi:putative acetyltransferase
VHVIIREEQADDAPEIREVNDKAMDALSSSLGHPEYYPRFGFVPASQYKVRCEWEVPDKAFMLLRLSECDVSGIAKYREEFSTVT